MRQAIFLKQNLITPAGQEGKEFLLQNAIAEKLRVSNFTVRMIRGWMIHLLLLFVNHAGNLHQIKKGYNMASITWNVMKYVAGDMEPGEFVIVPDPHQHCAVYAKKLGLNVRAEKVLLIDTIYTDKPVTRVMTKVTILEPEKFVPERVR